MKVKIKTKLLSVFLSLTLAFTVIPFIGTHAAYAAEDDDTCTINVTYAGKVFEGKEAKQMYGNLMMLANNTEVFTNVKAAEYNAAMGSDKKLLLYDLNGDGKYDFEVNVNEDISKLKITRCIDDYVGGGYQYEFSLEMIGKYLTDNPEFSSVYPYRTVTFLFPTDDPEYPVAKESITIDLSNDTQIFTGTEAAAVEKLIFVLTTSPNDISGTRTEYINDGESQTYVYDLDMNGSRDISVNTEFDTWLMDASRVPVKVTVTRHADCSVVGPISFSLSNDKINTCSGLKYGQQGVEYFYKSVTFDFSKPITGKAIELSKKSFTYNGKVQKPEIKTIGGESLVEGTDYTVTYSNPSSKNAGTYKITIKAKGNYIGTATATYKINKADNTMKAAGKTVAVKASALKKANKTLKRSAVISLTGAKGTVTYTKASGNKKITISKAGKVTVKKGLAKGTYKVKVNVKAAGTANYKAKAKTVTFTVKLK